MISSFRATLNELLARLVGALTDPQRGERTALFLLLGYGAAWSLYGALAKGSQDIHFDMGEMVAWSREISLGTPKHPPLGAWLVGAWFRVFPLADWAYYLFAMTLATVTLWIAWMMGGRYLDAEKRVVGLAMLTFVPFFNFHALKFNANTVMMPLWAATTWLFLRSYETRKAGFAALAGAAAAAAMLGKYWSIVLLAGLGIAVLCDPRRGAYFRSSAPWVTILVGAVGLLPHAVWLYNNNFLPFTYAMQSHPATIAAAFLSGLSYVAGALAMLTAPAMILMLAARPGRAALLDILWPPEPERRMVLRVFVLPLVVPMAAALGAKAKVVSLWAMGGMTLAPVVLLASPQVALSKSSVKRIVAAALVAPMIALVLSPLIALAIHRQGLPHHATHYRLLAQAIEKTWRESTDQPLRLVGSYNNLLYGTLFYLPERVSTLDILNPSLTPWTDARRVAREGIALTCPTAMQDCMKALEALTARGPAGKRVEVVLSRSYFGFPGKPEPYVIATVPPVR